LLFAFCLMLFAFLLLSFPSNLKRKPF
jgi:hypothetical protein